MPGLLAVLLSICLTLLSACSAPLAETIGQPQPTLPIRTLTFGQIELHAEIADSEEERRSGLAHRQGLEKNHGMLFVYTNSAPRYFTMRDTLFDLSIAFLDENGVILDIQKMQAQHQDLYRSRFPAKYALEVSAGWFADNRLGPGDRMALPINP
ncbi:MAG: DUF192 domain-containing protein [Gammaproteobacteria bacterium]|nr:DUF192 domain-containing protein [Gammaproteobacteria bacterium]